MKTITRLVILWLALMAALPASAQTTTTQTFLSVALGGGANNKLVTVASPTGMSASTSSTQTFIAICDASGTCEQMQIQSISGSILTVNRAVRGNAPPHQINAVVWYGGPGNFIPNTGNTSGVFVGTTPNGQCTRTSNQFLPVINVNTGEAADCILSPPVGSPTAAAATTGNWNAVSLFPRAFNSPYKKLAVSATTYTALTTDRIIGYNTAVAGTITIPALTGWVGKEYVIQIEITGSTSLTIATSTGQLINGAASIILGGATSFSGTRIYSDGSNWFAPRAQ